MRAICTGVFLFVAVLLPNVGSAQVFLLPTPPPDVNAAGSLWQIRGDPIFYAGSFYYPAGATVFFDGNVMVRTGVYEGIPLYVDSTLEPYSIVLVPTGGNRMRPYERRREGPLAGTVGSRAPSFPIQRDGDLSVLSPIERLQLMERAVRLFESPVTFAVPQTTSPASVEVPPTFEPAPSTAPPPPAPPSPPRPTGNDGVWIEYEGARWFSAGPVVGLDADRFVPAGSYRGFPVYRDKNGRADTIFVTVVADGPIAPYARR